LHADGVTVEGVERIYGNEIYAATILEQLGRFRDEAGCDSELIVELARALNRLLEQGATVREAVHRMRLVRANYDMEAEPR
jgi:hypothetical protein